MTILSAVAKRARMGPALQALVLLLWPGSGLLFAAGHAVTWTPNAQAMVRVDEHPLTDWNVYQMGKKTNPVLLQMGKRYLLIDQQKRQIFEVDAGQVSTRKGTDISWDPANHAEKPLETANWIVKDVGQAYRVSARLVAEGRVLDVQVPHPLNLKSLR